MDKIVGGVIGGVFGFLLLIVLPVILFFWIRKRKLAAAGGSKVRVELWSSHNMPAWITDQPVQVSLAGTRVVLIAKIQLLS